MRIERGVTTQSSTFRPAGRLTRAAAAVGLGAALALGGGHLAHAEPPMNLTTSVTDPAGALGGDASEARDAVTTLQEKRDLDLHVVYVDSFDGTAAQTWAQQTFTRSGFGGNDVLLAVATKDRRYATYTTPSSGLTPSDLQQVNREKIEPALREAANGGGSWAEATVAAADGLARATGGGGIGGTSGGSGGGIGTTVALGGGALAVAAGGAALLASRRRRKRVEGAQETTPQDGIGPVIATGPAGTRSAGVPADLSQRSAAALVALDDEIRSSGEELAFAEAQFGTQATVRFREAYERAKAGSVEAFRIQHQIDDGAIGQDQRPAAWQRIIDLATEADRTLEEHAAEFRQMRDLQSKVPQLLGDLETRIGEVTARIPAATQQLAALRATINDAPGRPGNPMEVLLWVAVVFVVLVLAMSAVQRHLENKWRIAR